MFYLKNTIIWDIVKNSNVLLLTTSELVSVLINLGIVSVVRKNVNKGQSKIISRQHEKIEFAWYPKVFLM